MAPSVLRQFMLALLCFLNATECCFNVWMKYGVKCFFYTNYVTHMHECRVKYNSRLAVPTKDEMDFLLLSTRSCRPNDVFKIDMYWLRRSVFTDTQSPRQIKYDLNWAPGEPNKNGPCLAIQYGALKDMRCYGGRMRYVCEKRCKKGDGECGSNPCLNGATCLDLGSKYQCQCPEGFTGDRCQYEIPGDPYYDCNEWVVEFQDLSCGCRIKSPGYPEALFGWNLNANDLDLKPNISISKVLRDDDRLSNFTCLMKWENPGQPTKHLTKSTIFRPVVTYGPSDDDTFIGDQTVVEVPFLPLVDLKCYSTNANPEPKARWEGADCLEGNSNPRCRFFPDPLLAITTAATLTVKCTLTNPYPPRLSASAIHTINFTWSGVAEIRHLKVEGVKHEFAAGTASRPLQLACSVVSRWPSLSDVHVEVYRLTGNKSQTEGGVRQTPDRNVSKSEVEFVKEYTIRSPASCHDVDTYRCSALYNMGLLWRFIRVRSDCIQSNGTKVEKAVGKGANAIMGSIFGTLGTLGVLTVVIGGAIWVQRWLGRHSSGDLEMSAAASAVTERRERLPQTPREERHIADLGDGAEPSQVSTTLRKRVNEGASVDDSVGTSLTSSFDLEADLSSGSGYRESSV